MEGILILTTARVGQLEAPLLILILLLTEVILVVILAEAVAQDLRAIPLEVVVDPPVREVDLLALPEVVDNLLNIPRVDLFNLLS